MEQVNTSKTSVSHPTLSNSAPQLRRINKNIDDISSLKNQPLQLAQMEKAARAGHHLSNISLTNTHSSSAKIENAAKSIPPIIQPQKTLLAKEKPEENSFVPNLQTQLLPPVPVGVFPSPPRGRQLRFITIKTANPMASSDPIGWVFEQFIRHKWIEIDGTESYGWWPRREGSETELAFEGVEGELNAITRRRGTATRDPHHGETATEFFHPYAQDNSKTDDQFREEIRRFATGFRGQYRILGGPNCHTFIDSLMESVGLEQNLSITPGLAEPVYAEQSLPSTSPQSPA